MNLNMATALYSHTLINLGVVNSLQLCSNIIHKHLGLSHTDHVHKGMRYTRIAPYCSLDARLYEAPPILLALVSKRIAACGADEGVTNPSQVSLEGTQESFSPSEEGGSLFLTLGSPMVPEVDDPFPVEARCQGILGKGCEGAFFRGGGFIMDDCARNRQNS